MSLVASVVNAFDVLLLLLLLLLLLASTARPGVICGGATARTSTATSVPVAGPT